MYEEGNTLDEDKLEELDKIEEKWDLYYQPEALAKRSLLKTTSNLQLFTPQNNLKPLTPTTSPTIVTRT